VDFENLDRADVSDVPLFGGLFDKPLRGADLTEENRVGSVYRGADGTLVAVVDQAVAVPESEVSVVNGKGRYTISMKPELTEVDSAQLGELGEIGSIQTLVKGVAPRETSIVLSGLTATAAPKAEGNIPLLGDIPGLQKLFMGGVYEVDKDELVILIRPTILRDDAVED
jgi:Flp pilus assembly secretin CpaC